MENAKNIIAAYCPHSPGDYTLPLLNAILDSKDIIGHYGLQSVLNDIIREGHANLAAVAEHYMTCIYYPCITLPHPTIVKIITTDTAQ